MAPNPMIGVLTRGHTDREGSPLKKEAEIGVMQLQVEGRQGLLQPLEAGKARKNSSQAPSEGVWSGQQFDFVF